MLRSAPCLNGPHHGEVSTKPAEVDEYVVMEVGRSLEGRDLLFPIGRYVWRFNLWLWAD